MSKNVKKDFSKVAFFCNNKDYVPKEDRVSKLSASSYGAMPLAEGQVKAKIKRHQRSE